MLVHTQKKIQEAVKKLLRNNEVTRPAVPVDEIAEGLEIRLRYEPAPDELSGALIRKRNSHATIGINSSHHPNRQRFTIAHEIAHFVLHKGEVHVDEDFRVNLRDGQSNWEEIEANAFAAELLMPTEFITRAAKRLQIVDQGDVRRLARRYQVSQRAMEIRLANLGLIDPSEGGQ